MEPNDVKNFMRSQRWNRDNARAYHAYRRVARRAGWLRFLASTLVHLPQGAMVLEVGAGTGFITGILSELGFQVEGLDLSEEMLAVARTNLSQAGLDQTVHLSPGDAEDLAFPDAHFEAVVSRWVLWTLPRPETALAEMTRVVRPGGSVVLVDGKQLTPGAMARIRSDLVNFLLTGRRPGWRGQDYAEVDHHLPRLTMEKTAKAFESLGLEVIETRSGLDREINGWFYHWLSGGGWSSYLVRAIKPA